MAPWFLDFGYAASTFGYSLFSDLLGLSTRPLVMGSSLLPETFPAFQSFANGGIFRGLMGTGSMILVVASLGVLTRSETLGRGLSSLYLLDSMLQICQFLFPFGEPWAYPASRTGLLTLMLQLPLSAAGTMQNAAWRKVLIQKHGHRLALFAVSVSFRYMSGRLLDPATPSSTFSYVVACICFTFAVTPQTFWRQMASFIEKLGVLAARAVSFVYGIISYLAPLMQDFVWKILEHPMMVRINRLLIAPCWQVVSPLLLPLATSNIFFSCGLSVWNSWNKGIASTHIEGGALFLGQAFIVSTAGLSTLVLAVHATSRMHRRQQPDPLQNHALARCLALSSKVSSFPVRWIREVLRFLVMRVLPPVLNRIWSCWVPLFKCAIHYPVLSIPAVLLANVAILRSLSSASGVLSRLVRETAQQSGALSSLLARYILSLQAAAQEGVATDSTAAVIFIAVIEVFAYAVVYSMAETLSIIVHERTGDAFSVEDLNDLACAMDDPRQCGRCAFGPVDCRGCSNLSTHHGDVAVAAGGNRTLISNACPRCGWFVPSLSQWPDWDGGLQTHSGRAMFRQRVWCEIVVVVRASSKALVFPYALMQLGAKLNWNSSLTALLAFSYLIPWTVENAKLYLALDNPRVFARTGRRRAPVRRATGGGNAADCGAAPQTEHLPYITQSQALENLMTGSADSVFLRSGDSCPICLEAFSEHAVQVASRGGPGAEVSRTLLGLVPPVVVLRCGHPLHGECAEAAVASGGARHVRCPVCREPVTLSGEATARAFS